MPIITLTTDFGKNGYYLAAVKGKLLSLSKNVNIVNICDVVKPFSIAQAAYILGNAYHHFPEQTVHLVGVWSIYDKQNRYIAIKHNNHFFVGADNGVFSIMFKNTVEEAVKLPESDLEDQSTFPELHYFTEYAIKLAEGATLTDVGISIKQLKETYALQPTYSDNMITASVLFIDTYQNIILNVTKALFEKVGLGRSFSVNYNSRDYINKMNKHFGSTSALEKCCFFNDAGYLQISMVQGKASEMFGIYENDKILIEFTG